MAFFFALVENLSSPLINRGSLFRVLIPGVSWQHQTFQVIPKSQGIVVFDRLYISEQFSHLKLKFYPPYYTSLAA